VLGPLEVRVDGAPVAIGSSRLQVILACMLLQPGQVVQAGRVDTLLSRISRSPRERCRKEGSGNRSRWPTNRCVSSRSARARNASSSRLRTNVSGPCSTAVPSTPAANSGSRSPRASGITRSASRHRTTA
jgi:hypothetical protein